MNKQELLDELNWLMDTYSSDDGFYSGVRTGLAIAIAEIEKLDEPEKVVEKEKQEELKRKVVIPQFVADWIEEVKGTYTLKLLFNNSNMPSSVEDWLYCNNENCELMALAWIYGYEVEKEKLYIIELSNKQRLASVCGVVKFYDEATWVITGINTRLTQSEIESVDPLLMRFAEEVE